MSSNIITQSQNPLETEKDEFAKQQERMLVLMEQSNKIREDELDTRKRELEQAIEHDRLIRERTIADFQQLEVEKDKNIKLEEKNRIEHQKLVMVEQQVTDLKIIIELLKNYLSQTVPSQDSKLSNFHQKLDWILELLRIILSRMLPDAEKAEKERLSELLKHLAQSGNSINIKPDMTVNAGMIDSLTNTENTTNYKR